MILFFSGKPPAEYFLPPWFFQERKLRER